jgi:hypothetical protein
MLNIQMKSRFIAVCCLQAVAIGVLTAQSPPMTPTPAQPQPSDPVQQTLRTIRNSLWDNMAGVSGHVSPPRLDALDPSVPPPVTAIHLRTVDELPGAYSDTILTGEITNSQAFLSNDGHSLYTETTVRVNQIFNQQSPDAIEGGTIVLEQPGGRLVMPNGRVLSHLVTGLGDYLQVGGRYAFFLVYVPKAQCYKLTKAWWLNNGVVRALSQDDLARVRIGSSQYDGKSESALMSALSGIKATYRDNH